MNDSNSEHRKELLIKAFFSIGIGLDYIGVSTPTNIDKTIQFKNFSNLLNQLTIKELENMVEEL